MHDDREVRPPGCAREIHPHCLPSTAPHPVCASPLPPLSAQVAASMFGKEAALFCPSGTMTNQSG